MAFVERRWLMGSLMAAVVAFLLTGWFTATVGTFLLGYGIAFWTRDDPTVLVALVRAMRMRTYYDASAYRRVEVDLQ